MIRAAALCFLLLAECDDMPRARTESEIRDMAEDVADTVSGAQVAELQGQIARLEQRIDQLESDKASLLVEIANLKSSDDWAEDSIQRLFCNDGFAASCRALNRDN